MSLSSTSPRRDARRVNSEKLVAIASGKGGVGKTWLAVTLCHALARQGRRVLLFDGDLGLANIDIQLGLMPERDLQGVLAGKLSLRGAILPYRPDNAAGFDIIAGQAGSGSLAGLRPDRLDALADRVLGLDADYDHVVIDLGAGVENTVRQLARPAATCLVVTTEEPTSLTDAYAFIKLTRRDYPETAFKIVVNMAASAQAGERTYRTLAKACQSFLGVTPPLAGVIRRDEHVPDAIRHQTPLLTRHPNSPAALDVAHLADLLRRKP
jgi:flagellar biosynthesis protein FlhG